MRPGPLARLRDLAFGLWAWVVFAGCILFGLAVGLLVPGRHLRSRLTSAAARGVFVLSGADVRVRGLENLPGGAAIVVANHASYLDGVLLKGYLPSTFSFVIKGEMRNNALAHFLLHRAGSRFVERKEPAGKSRDARRIVKAAQKGQSLAFFAEGTFRPYPGIGRFQPGAFVAAVRGQMPVVPVAIRGTREMHPGEPKLPKPVPLYIDILPPIPVGDAAFSDHRRLAEEARRRIIAATAEPDLLAG